MPKNQFAGIASLCRAIDCCVASFGSGLLLCFCFSFSAHTLLQHIRTINPALVRDGFYLHPPAAPEAADHHAPNGATSAIVSCFGARIKRSASFSLPYSLLTASFFVATHSGTPQARLWMSTAHVKQIQNQQHTYLSCK